MINASCPPFRLTIGGQDLTRYCRQFECIDSDNGQGLITQQGRIVLAQSDREFNLNDRTSPFWKRGLVIELDVFNASSSALQRFKTLRVLQPAYDPQSLSQSLDVGCVLKLIDYPLPRNCDTVYLDVALGGGKTKAQIINDFLAHFGLPPMVGEVPGSINYPILGESESLAALAGRLAYNSGYALWVDQQENVVPISREFSTDY